MNKAERGYANVSGVQGEIRQPSIAEMGDISKRKTVLQNPTREMHGTGGLSNQMEGVLFDFKQR